MLDVLAINLMTALLLLIFLGGFWLLNFLLGLYVNTQLLDCKWDTAKFKRSLRKMILLIIIIFLAVLLVTTAPYAFTDNTDVISQFNNLAVIGAVITTVLLYGIQVMSKFLKVFQEQFDSVENKPPD